MNHQTRDEILTGITGYLIGHHRRGRSRRYHLHPALTISLLILVLMPILALTAMLLKLWPLLLVAGGAYALYRARHPRRVVSITEVRETARSRARNRSRVVGLGPNANRADERMFRRDQNIPDDEEIPY